MAYLDLKSMQTIKESCPVCWRDFSSTLKPFSLICGHSYCYECLILLKKCPLCRTRVVQSTSRPTNYALLSLIEKADNIRPADTRDQYIQTDEVQRIDIQPRLDHTNNPSTLQRNTKGKKKGRS